MLNVILMICYAVFGLVVFTFAVASFFALPMIWYHCKKISQKMDIFTALLREVADNPNRENL